MKPPVRANRPEWGHTGMIHWDVDTSRPTIPFGVQGVLYLTTRRRTRAASSVFGFHRGFDAWVKTQPADRDPWSPDLEGLEMKPIAGKAGDLIIWDRMLAHGNGHNHVRQAAPGPVHHHAAGGRRRGAAAAAHRVVAGAPAGQVARGGSGWPRDPRDREHRTQSPADLTELGRKLLGLDAWD